MGGRAAPHKPERRFLGAMRHGTKHCCAGPERPDSSKGKDESGSPCGALPANSEDDLYYIQMHHSAGGGGGSRGSKPTELHAHGTPSALRSLLLHSDGNGLRQGAIFNSSFAYEMYFLLQGCSRPVVSCYSRTRRRRTKMDVKERIIRKKF